MNDPSRGVGIANSTTTEMAVAIEQAVASETASGEPENDAVDTRSTSERETQVVADDSTNDAPADGLSAMDDAYGKFQFERAAKPAAEILEYGIEDRHVLEVAVKSCFAIHRFAEAGRHLQTLQQNDWLDDETLPTVEQVAEYEALWAYEQQIRQQEASAEPEHLLPRVTLQTNLGEIELELFENEAPQAVAHFIYLIESGRYDGSEFLGLPEAGLLQTAEKAWGGKTPPGWYDLESTSGEAGETTADEAELGEIMAEDSAELPPPIFPSAPIQRSDGPHWWECFADDARSHFRGSVSLACYGINAYGSEMMLAWTPQPLLNRDSQFEEFAPYAEELGDWKARPLYEGSNEAEPPMPPAPVVDASAQLLPKREARELAGRDDGLPVAQGDVRMVSLVMQSSPDAATERQQEAWDPAFTNFGRVVRGIELLPALQDGGRIISARVILKRDRDYQPGIPGVATDPAHGQRPIP